MKKVFLVMIACCFFAAQTFGQESGNSDNPNAAEVTFEKIEHDFGKVSINSVPEIEFTFTNTGKEPLIIHRCNAPCGCTTPICPLGKPILPGETGTVKVTYSTTSYAHKFDRSFTMTTNAKNSTLRLTVKGEVTDAETASK